MPVDKDTFVSITKNDFKWPYSKPLTARPSQPPVRTKPNNCYVAKLVEPYCHCDAHLYAPEMGRYKTLAEKEKMLYKELDELNQQMAALSGEILDHPCDTDDEKMETIYQSDYIKRGLPLVQYRKLMPAIDSPTGVPIKGEQLGIKSAYRDPTRFRLTAIPVPHVDVCPRIYFDRVLTALDEWFAPRTGMSEYQDTISKMGMSIIKSRQQYMEPLPSTRRRVGDTCMY